MLSRAISLARDESGQDLIEYALLSGAIGIVGVAAWNAVGGGIGTAYTGWDTGVQNVWEPPTTRRGRSTNEAGDM